MSARFPLLLAGAAGALALLASAPGESADSASQKWYRAELKALGEQFSTQFGEDNLSAAEKTAQDAVDLAERGFGPESPEAADALRNLTVIWETQNKEEKLEPVLKRALAIREQTLGPDHPDTAKALSNVGRYYHFHGSPEKAEAFYLRALEIKERAFGKEDLLIASSLHDLTIYYKDQERYTEALTYMEREVAIWESAVDPDHPMLEVTLGSYADVLQKVGKTREAEVIQNRFNRLRRKKE